VRKPSYCAARDKSLSQVKWIICRALCYSPKFICWGYRYVYIYIYIYTHIYMYCSCYSGEESWTTRFTRQTETGRRAGAGHVFVISVLHTKVLTACTNGSDKFKCHIRMLSSVSPGRGNKETVSGYRGQILNRCCGFSKISSSLCSPLS